MHVYLSETALGWFLVNDDGAITLTTPEDTRPGDNRLVIHTADSELLGWDRLKVVGPAAR